MFNLCLFTFEGHATASHPILGPHDAKRRSTPTILRLRLDRLPEATREMKTTSNCANRRCHAEGEPRELVLSEAKDGVAGVCVFPAIPVAIPAHVERGRWILACNCTIIR